MLNELEWPNLEDRREQASLAFHKILSVSVAIDRKKDDPHHDKRDQQNERAPSEDSDQPGPVAKDPSFLHADSEDWSDWADAQTDLSLCWAHTYFVGLSRLIWPLHLDWDKLRILMSYNTQDTLHTLTP